METWRSKGFSVSVLSVANMVIAYCTRDSQKQSQPWLSSGEFFTSARDCIDRKNGIQNVEHEGYRLKTML